MFPTIDVDQDYVYIVRSKQENISLRKRQSNDSCLLEPVKSSNSSSAHRASILELVPSSDGFGERLSGCRFGFVFISEADAFQKLVQESNVFYRMEGEVTDVRCVFPIPKVKIKIYLNSSDINYPYRKLLVNQMFCGAAPLKQ